MSPADPAAAAPLGNPARVLLIRPSALGDVCRSVAALVSLRRALPRARIDWLVNDDYTEAVKHHPDLSEVYPFPRQRLGGRAMRRLSGLRFARDWLGELRGQGYEAAVDLQGLARSGLIAYLSGACWRLGFANAAEGAWLAYTHRRFADRAMPDVERGLSLLEHVGVPPVRDLRLYTGPDEEAWLDAMLAQRGGVDRPYALIAPTARWASKQWPLPRFTEVGRRLLSEPECGGRLFILAGPAERHAVSPMIQELQAEHGTDRVCCPSTTVGQVMALIRRARLLVCNDSAPMHMAVGLGCPMVAIFGPTDPGRTGPYGRDEDVLAPPPGTPRADPADYRRKPNDQRLIRSVSVDRVWEAALARLQPGADRPPTAFNVTSPTARDHVSPQRLG